MSKNQNGLLILIALLFCCLAFFGSSATQGKLLKEERKVINIAPVEFFSGELKRLKGHLDLESAVCLKIKAEGTIKCVPEVEVWLEGKRVDIPKYGANADSRSDEVSFTLRRVENPRTDKVRYLAVFGGILSFDRILEEPIPPRPVKVQFGPVSLDQNIKLKSGESVVVWAMGAGHGVDLSKRDEVESELKKLPWVMFVRFRTE